MQGDAQIKRHTRNPTTAATAEKMRVVVHEAFRPRLGYWTHSTTDTVEPPRPRRPKPPPPNPGCCGIPGVVVVPLATVSWRVQGPNDTLLSSSPPSFTCRARVSHQKFDSTVAPNASNDKNAGIRLNHAFLVQ